VTTTRREGWIWPKRHGLAGPQPRSFRKRSQVDNLHPLPRKSRNKEEIWWADLSDGGWARARRLGEVDPLRSAPHIELGEVLAYREAIAVAALYPNPLLMP